MSVKSRADLADWDAVPAGPELPPSYNVAPTKPVYAVAEHADRLTGVTQRQVRAMQWGLVPSWAEDLKIGGRLINARVETLADKPSWRAAFRKRRAAVPAAGYYEWAPREHDGTVRKQPYYIHPAAGEVLAFAGLYEIWRDPTKADDDPDRWLWSTVIVTADAAGPAGEVHDRTPLILPRDRIAAWLDPELTDPADVHAVLADIEMQPLEVRPVSTLVNRVGNDGPDLLEPLEFGRSDEPLQLTLTGRAAACMTSDVLGLAVAAGLFLAGFGLIADWVVRPGNHRVRHHARSSSNVGNPAPAVLLEVSSGPGLSPETVSGDFPLGR